MAMKLCKYGHFTERGTRRKCPECRRLRAVEKRAENPEKYRARDRRTHERIRESRNQQSKAHHARNPKIAMLRHARKRAHIRGFPCTITLDDFSIPKLCPLLEIELRVAENGVKPYSPSLDRIVPGLGYVPGNVWVISHRANALKGDATVQELRLLLTNLENYASVRRELVIPFSVELPKDSFPWA